MWGRRIGQFRWPWLRWVRLLGNKDLATRLHIGVGNLLLWTHRLVGGAA